MVLHRRQSRIRGTPGERPDLKGKVTVPDVLIQAHSASLGLTFYDGHAFPAEYRGDAFAAEHGSWNRSKRTGYKMIRIRLKDGVPTGEYEDFVTGFVVNDSDVWGRPVGVAVAHDGALLVSEDGNGTIWRITRAPEIPTSKSTRTMKVFIRSGAEIGDRSERHLLQHAGKGFREGVGVARPSRRNIVAIADHEGRRLVVHGVARQA